MALRTRFPEAQAQITEFIHRVVTGEVDQASERYARARTIVPELNRLMAAVVASPARRQAIDALTAELKRVLAAPARRPVAFEVDRVPVERLPKKRRA